MVDEHPAASPTVYVVDSDAAVRDSLRALLELMGWRVETYGSAESFLDQGELRPFGCVVTETHLPGISGIELQRELCERGVKLPVILLASRADVPMAVRAIRGGAVDFIEKPFVDRLLVRRIRKTLEKLAAHDAT